MKELKKKARDTLVKVSEFLSEPSVRKTSKFALGVLETMAYINPKNPLSIATGSFSLVDTALDAFEIPHPTPTEHFVKNNDLEVKIGGLPRILVESEVMDYFESRPMFTDGPWLVKELVVSETERFYYAENQEPSATHQDPLAKLAQSYYYTKGFNFNKLFDIIWKKYKNGLSVTLSNPAGKSWELNSITLDELEVSEYLYIGDIDPESFANDIKKFRDENTSRSYMLSGEPGTGKTSLVIETARCISNRIIRIDPTLAHMFTSNELDFLIENLNPDILIFDDFDRAAMAQDSQHLLFLLESIKQRFPKMVIFATVNYFSKLDKALVRPGRFDEIIWFDLPSPEIRARIAERYLKLNDILVTTELIDKIVVNTEGLSPVYIKELCIRLRHKGPEALESIIAGFNRANSELEGMYTEEVNVNSNQKMLEEQYFIDLQKKIEAEFSEEIF